MTKEQLMRPRYKVILDYPWCPYEVGTTLMVNDDGELYSEIFGYAASKYKVVQSIADKHPCMFRAMKWWEERKLEDMPDYVRIDKKGGFLYNGELELIKEGSIVRVGRWYLNAIEELTVVLPTKPYMHKPRIDSKKPEQFTTNIFYPEHGMSPATEEEYMEYHDKTQS